MNKLEFLDGRYRIKVGKNLSDWYVIDEVAVLITDRASYFAFTAKLQHKFPQLSPNTVFFISPTKTKIKIQDNTDSLETIKFYETAILQNEKSENIGDTNK